MEFFIIKNDEQYGPYTIDQLREIGIDANTPVWHKGLDNWILADEIDELRDVLALSPVPDNDEEEIIEEPEVSYSAPPQWDKRQMRRLTGKELRESRAQSSYKPKKSRTGLWVTLGVVATLAIILFVTNPKKEDHCREITNVSRAWVNETIDNFGGDNLIGGVVKSASTWLIRSAVDENVQIDNYGLFSIGYIDTGAEKSRVSLGILGNVFTFNKEQLSEKVNEIISKYMQDAIDISEWFSFDGDNLDDMLVDGLVDMIGDRMFGERPREHTTTPEEGNIYNENQESSILPIGEEFLREGAKTIIREGADYLMDQVDNIGR